MYVSINPSFWCIDKPNDDRSHIGAIIGGVVGGIMGVILLVCTSLLYHKETV